MTMKDLIESFPEQLVKGLEIAKNAKLNPAKNTFKNIVITGLGGSGIGGTIVSDLIRSICPYPITINNDYTLPAFVDSESLLIVSSYSGNTEETLSAMKKGLEKGAEVACITSGGAVLELAKVHGLNVIVVPDGFPPRSCLGYSLIQQCRLLSHYGAHLLNYESLVSKSINLIKSEITDIQQKAKELANALHNKTGVLYAEARFEGLITRVRQQLNENSKALCWHHVLPEMNHNELVGWGGGKSEYHVVLFRSSLDHERTAKRMDLAEEIISQKTNVTTVWAKGDSQLEMTLYLNSIGDWTSWYLSELNGVDAIEIDVINYLKSQLAKF